MNRRARKIFTVGQDVAGARVLEILQRKLKPGTMAYPSRLLLYRVVCAHCGHERLVGHSALVERLASGATGCRSCKGKRRQAPKMALWAWR